MEEEADLYAPPVPPPPSSSTDNHLLRPINHDFHHSLTSTTSSSSSSSFSSSSPRFIRHVQAAFKRHRPLGTMQSNSIRPRRMLVPQREASKSSASNLVLVESQHVPMVDGQKKVQFSLGSNSRSRGADDLMASGTDSLLSHMGSLALTEMVWDGSNQPEAVTVISHDLKPQKFHSIEADESLRSDRPNSSFLVKRAPEVQDQMHQFRNFLHGDLNHPMTQSSVVGSSCATTTVVNSASAPIINSMTYSLHPSENMVSNMPVAPMRDCNVNPKEMPQENMAQPSCNSCKRPTFDTQIEVKEYDMTKELQGRGPGERDFRKDCATLDDNPNNGKEHESGVTDLQSQPSLSKNPSSDMKAEPSKSETQEKVASGKAAPRKRNSDSDLFIKVNGKLYQRLGKIGSGGSSEVHKVISSDCTIYALKKIKLKGRDYATAFGFCQEMEYLNKLKGKNNIIQLIDYEVTDKTLLKEVLNGCMSDKDRRVKEDGYIYMVLEYGEIDLAHMLSQKWRELDSTNSTIDENWLRFYWQQVLQAVNTIHEERIVHSDLKPANFLLVRGSLKLIDFGIAKAIMSDTTNIQRDSQVGTLSYMSPEAFMCNETDANGNTIKCGRPSDIWSLGCILYQMVYGRTPFSEYKTFWAKFKVITDPNHEIKYEPVSNPWLLDLMKKCLAWDRNERWRIPQLLQHPFLVPRIPAQLCPPQEQSCKLLQLIAESCANNQKTMILCNQLQELLSYHPSPEIVLHASISRDEQRKLLCKMSNICFQLQEQLAE
ncbi:hypothetical protein RHSIM_Rhsim06G0108200 [Rhododendron simsii]|uniref:Protein kinase domain-containing protein n=1 Tax=Rhododendron simsii TaxID=118357 RepID=A0A834LLW8_RHOSS|nr:hypothetical protein RHSIM_Rhsim06G0108200 [Rhododendron simsii]